MLVEVAWFVIAVAALLLFKVAHDVALAYVKNERDSQLFSAVRSVVRAAEQMFEDGDERLDYAMDILSRLFPDVDPDVLRSYVEYAVYELNRELDLIDNMG